MLGAAASRPRLDRRRCRLSCGARGIPFFNTQMGKGTVAGGSQPVHGHGRALRARLRARSDRPGRPDHRHRSRHDREAALHHGAGRAEGDPCRLHAGERRGGLLPACRGGRRCRAEPRRCSPTGSRASCRTPAALLPLRERHPRAHRRSRRRGPLPADAAAHRARRAPGDARRRHRRASTTACTRSGSPATTAPTSPTRCCSTTRSPRWALACPRR